MTVARVQSTQREGERALLRQVLRGDGELGKRFQRLRKFSQGIRTSEFHITNSCNLRCRGCWFFEYEYDRKSHELGAIESWRMFAKEQAKMRGVTSALLIGGEPSLYADRIAAFVDEMRYVTVSTNGLRKLPSEGFEDVAVALTVFGGVGADDGLRAIRPSGARFSGLFETALRNYRNDPRATFIYAISPDHLEVIEPTVRLIRDNGNVLSFNYYSSYGSENPLRLDTRMRVLDQALRIKEAYPDTVINTPYSIRTLVTGRTEWASFGYDVCPSISTSHPAHERRLRNGNPVLPDFNSYASDAETLNFCCASGACAGCRDSQAVYSWLLVSMKRFLGSSESLETWLDTAESYWRQFRWAPYHRSNESLGVACPRPL